MMLVPCCGKSALVLQRLLRICLQESCVPAGLNQARQVLTRGDHILHIEVLELCDKAHDIEIQGQFDDIKWHFIGHLQRNKVSKVLAVPHLFVIETVDSFGLAKAVNDTWQRLDKQSHLKVMVQINTSAEENKSGCRPDEAIQLVKYVREKCPNLDLIGLMTIGVYDHDPSTTNPDFVALVRIRAEVCKDLDISPNDLELSMGMSADYEQAVEMGSTNVRVGTKIFGTRGKPYTRPAIKDSGLQDNSDDEH
uniref:Pyridoxal phosphate homeostasis protein n=1 Tax=Arion vulgaris TaxID=1028688 RepID=A0A0B6ZCP3_9EUPU